MLPRRWAAGRGAGGDGLLIAGKATMVKEVVVHEPWTGSWGPPAERSSMMFVTDRLHFGMAGVGELGIATIHVHRQTAKRSSTSQMTRYFLKHLGGGLRACGARVLTGDANMMMFTLAEGLARESNLLVTLVAFHRELTASTTIPAMDARGLDSAMRFDSCGIWVIGGVSLVKVLSMATELEMAALHLAMLEVSQGRFKSTPAATSASPTSCRPSLARRTVALARYQMSSS